MNRLFTESVYLAISALNKHKTRAALSVLGISIGIMSLVVIMSAGESLRAIFISQLQSFGTDFIQIEIKIPNTRQASAGNATGIAQGVSITTLSMDDKRRIDALDNIRSSYGAVLGQAVANTLYNERQLNYMAVSSEFSEIDSAGINRGRFFTDEDERSLNRVVVMGSEAAKRMFPNQDPVGQTIKLQRVSFRVIGVLNERGSTGFISMDDWIFVPLKSAQKLLLGFDHLLFILTKVRDTSLDRETAEEITAILRENRGITDPNKDDFAVTTQAESVELVSTILNGITLVLSIIASVALLVGGVGIMNIMYVAVNERVFEIGLRKALGATIGRIKLQFLIEAVVVTLLGGIFGMLLAILVITLIFYIAQLNNFDWPFAVSGQAILLALAFSSLVGLFFGYYPARKASLLQPVIALRERGMS